MAEVMSPFVTAVPQASPSLEPQFIFTGGTPEHHLCFNTMWILGRRLGRREKTRDPYRLPEFKFKSVCPQTGCLLFRHLSVGARSLCECVRERKEMLPSSVVHIRLRERSTGLKWLRNVCVRVAGGEGGWVGCCSHNLLNHESTIN